MSRTNFVVSQMSRMFFHIPIVMNTTYIITPRVIKAINALPAQLRGPISNALSRDLLLGEAPETTLTPVQCMVYAMIRFYVRQDSERARKESAASLAASGVAFPQAI